MNYCVYLTIYSGNKLPPFYIGHTKVEKIYNGYRGSVSSKKYKSIWKSEIKNNVDLFKTIIIKKFDRKEDALNFEIRVLNSFNAHRNPLYINLAISDSRFMFDPSGHTWNRGRKLSEEHKEKLRQAHLGMKQSKETIEKRVSKIRGIKRPKWVIEKISSKQKGKFVSDETREKIKKARANQIMKPRKIH